MAETGGAAGFEDLAVVLRQADHGGLGQLRGKGRCNLGDLFELRSRASRLRPITLEPTTGRNRGHHPDGRADASWTAWGTIQPRIDTIETEMYDAVKRAEDVARIVCRGDRRKYHRFRPARFYGGIATADCVGCCLACLFCWSWRQVARPGKYGEFYSPEQVARKLVSICRRKGFSRLRISGAEPTIGRRHLLQVLRKIPEVLHFILETNGILLGHDSSYAEELARFSHLHVRVSLKGTTEEEFSRLTGAEPEGFGLQLQALEHLACAGVSVHPAVMVSFSPDFHIEALRRRLERIRPDFADFEEEDLVLYGDVGDRLERAGIGYHDAIAPGR